MLMFVGFVVAEGGWGDINTGGNSSGNGTKDEPAAQIPEDNTPAPQTSDNSGEPKLRYTKNFYLALGLGTLAVLVVLYMVYLFIRGPVVKWKKPKR